MINRRHVLTAAAALGGLALFVYAVRAAGVDEILDGIRRVGWGLAAILGLGGLRFVLRTISWRLCMPAGRRLPFFDAFAAFVAGDAVGNVTPLGLLASEPTKLLLSRRRLATSEAVAALALDNLVYAASVLLMIAFGLFVMVATIPLPIEWQEGTAAALVGMVVAAAVALRLVRRGAWRAARGERPRWRQRLSSVRQAVVDFASVHPFALFWMFCLHGAFHAASVLEAYLTLRWLLDAGPAWNEAVVFATLDRVLTAGFKFVPFRAGVDEASSGALAPLLGLPLAAGVTVAVVRKVRNLSWALVGMLVIAAHPARGAPEMGRPGSALEPRS